MGTSDRFAHHVNHFDEEDDKIACQKLGLVGR